MNYNTSLPELRFREYGRYVQTLIDQAKTIVDDERRQSFAESIIEVMLVVNPATRNLESHKQKLWSHLFALAGEDFNVTPPCTIIKQSEKGRPPQVAYPRRNIRFAHYGKMIAELLTKAAETDDEEKRAEFTAAIAAFMKANYKEWNRDSVTDDTIRKELAILSDGELMIDAETGIVTGNRKDNRQNVNLIHLPGRERRKRGNDTKRPDANSKRTSPSPNNTTTRSTGTTRATRPQNAAERHPRKEQSANHTPEKDNSSNNKDNRLRHRRNPKKI